MKDQLRWIGVTDNGDTVLPTMANISLRIKWMRQILRDCERGARDCIVNTR